MTPKKNATKDKVSKMCRTKSRIWDRKGFTKNVRQADALQIRNKRKRTLYIDMAVVSTSILADSVFNPKYYIVVDI